MKLFIDKNAEIVIEIFVSEDGGNLSVWSESSKPEKIPEKYSKHKVCFRMPTYKDNLVFLDSGVKFSDNGEISFVTNQSRFTRFSTLLKSWDFKAEDGSEIPATVENAEKLVGPIASFLIAELERALQG